jgi:hypothetical protein
MARADRLAQDGSLSFFEDDNEHRLPRDTFEISDPAFDNGVLRRYKAPFWRRWLGVTGHSRRTQRLDVDEEEGDGLLRNTQASITDGPHKRADKSCNRCCIYGGNTALSIL